MEGGAGGGQEGEAEVTHDAEIRADLAFNDCRYALAELEILLPHLDTSRLASLIADADDLHESVARFAEKASKRVPKKVPAKKLEVVK